MEEKSGQGVRFIIQVDRPDEKLNMSKIHAMFDGTGIELDPGYGPILINPGLGRYVVRGKATARARAKAEKIPGVRFFADARQEKI
jgi:hypothetical protein